MAVLGQRFALVTHYIRGLRGGSQPFLAEGGDGDIYVVKFAANIQGSSLAFNEAAGTELYRAYGLPVAPWRPLVVTNDFLNRNPDCWTQTSLGRQKPASGICFGSHYLGRRSSNVYEILPGTHFSRIKNATDFWLAWLVDVCAWHADLRQAIFLEADTRELDAVFIDFGHMFGGPDGNKEPHFRASRYRDDRIYPRLNWHFLQTVRRNAVNINADRLWRQLTTIPQEWQSGSARNHLAAALNRLLDSRFVDKTLDAMVDTVQSCSRNEAAPTSDRRPPRAILPPRIQGKRGSRTVVA